VPIRPLTFVKIQPFHKSCSRCTRKYRFPRIHRNVIQLDVSIDAADRELGRLSALIEPALEGGASLTFCFERRDAIFDLSPGEISRRRDAGGALA
jgi:hypothetical protein